MPKCTKIDCKKEPTRALKLLFYAAEDTIPAPAFVNIPVCDEHNLTDDEMKWFLEANWKQLCAAFTQSGKSQPCRELTRWEWAPLKEAEDFWREGIAAAKLAAANRN